MFLTGCERNRDFVPFLRREIFSLGGKTNSMVGTIELQGKWSIKRDQFGELINTEGIQFDALTNVLTATYGEPKFYTGAYVGHGPVYLFPLTNVGISILVSATKSGAEVTLLKPM